MAELTMSVDGFDPSTIGLEVVNADTRRHTSFRKWTTGTTPLRAPGVLLSSEPTHEQRELVVEGRLTGTSTSNFESRRDELLARLDRDDEVEISFSDTSRIFYARFLGMQTSTRSLALEASDNVVLRWLLRRPWSYDSATSSLSTITTATAVPLGTAPTFDATITLNGSATNPTITYKNSTGGTVHTLSFTISLGSTEFLTINMQDGTIVDDSSGSQVSAMDSGSVFPFALDPRDGEHWNSNWPTLEVDGGDLDLTYRPAHW